jgi:hypothetical protein
VAESVASCSCENEKLVAEAGDNSGTQRKGELSLLEAATKQRLVKTEKTLSVLSYSDLSNV